MIKNVLLLGLVLLLSCQKSQPERFKTSSKEIDLLKKGLSDYENANWDEWSKQYADTAKIFQNTWLEGASPAEVMNRHQKLIAHLSSYSFDKKDITMEQIIDDSGRTWVNFWGIWKGTFKENSTEVFIPVHLTIQFENGKVVKEYGFWDTAQLNEKLKETNYASSKN